MKKIYNDLLFVMVVFVICLWYQPAQATGTTHIWAPSTDVQPFRLWHITSDLYFPVAPDLFGSRLPTVTNVGLTVGILPFKNLNAEIGFDHKSGFGSIDSYPLYGNAKIGIPENAFGGISPACAMGIFDVGTKAAMTDYNVIYGKLAKTVTINKISFGRFSAGYFSGNKKLLLNESGGKDNNGLLMTWERTISELSDKLWICFEYMGTKSVYGSFNVGAAWKFAPNVSIIGGYDIFNNPGLVDTATLQVDIDI